VVPTDECDDEPVGDASRDASSWTHAQKKSLRATEQRRQDVVERRVRYEEAVEGIDADRLVFLDESGCNIAMTPARAWAPEGERVEAFRPMNWGDNVTLIGAVRTTGLVALRSMRGAMKTLDFLDFVARDLVPKLRKGDVVVLDNLRQHHDPSVRRMVENAGASLLYLPPYSPELNPIEPFWARFKKRLRRFEARCVDSLLDAIRELRRQRVNLRQTFAHCGYA
jgi:transposase